MKSVTKLFASASLALLVIAAIGAGVASADGPVAFEASTSGFTLTGGSFEMKCDSTMAGEFEESAGAIDGEITSFTLSSCSGSCPIAGGINLPWHLSGSSTGQGDADLSITSGGSGSPGAALGKCTVFKVYCTYTSGKLFATMYGGTELVLYGSVARTGGSALCPSTGTWTGTYAMTTSESS